MTKKKVAILGGGVGSMVAAFGLTSTPELRDAYEITVYQRGHRLGGKGASGRNREESDRIEEHGLHLWLGFYENAFRVMREAYGELGRPPGSPLATWQDAFKNQSYAVLESQLGGPGLADDGWFAWTFDFPSNGELPGEATDLPSLWRTFAAIIEWLADTWGNRRLGLAEQPVDPPVIDHPTLLQELGRAVLRGEQTIERLTPFGDVGQHPGGARLGLLQHVRTLVRSLDAVAANHSPTLHGAIAWLIREFMKGAWNLLEPVVGTDQEAYKLWVAVNLAGSFAVGFLESQILFKGFDAINGLDLAAWLAQSGANDVTLASGPVKGIYDLVFGFIGGNARKGSLAAGVGAYGALRMLLTYKGSIFWEMQAGMGDTVFTPLYQVLQKRGVRFAFFERVVQVHPSADGASVESVDMERQAVIENGGEYRPLFDVKGLPCWPSEPFYDQLEKGGEIEKSGVDFEDAYSAPWGGEQGHTLTRGTDFDAVVLGISIGMLPYVCGELAAVSAPFNAMLHGARTVQTMAAQVWMKPDLASLGWQTPVAITERPVMSSYVDPLNTWADMSHLLVRESWPAASAPLNVSYFCGPLLQEVPLPPLTDHGYPARALAVVNKAADDFFNQDVGWLWPNMATSPDGTGFKWDQVLSQFRRANVDPSETYVLSVPGTIDTRLAAGSSGFDNLVLAGDWVATPINAGCVEGATMGGLLAAEALSGKNMNVVGFMRSFDR